MKKVLQALEHTRHSYLETIHFQAKVEGWMGKDLQNVVNVINRDLDIIQEELDMSKFREQVLEDGYNEYIEKNKNLQSIIYKIDEILYDDKLPLEILSDIQRVIKE